MPVDLALAREMVAACLRAAHDQQALVSAAVVDSGGVLVCFERMDDAEIAGPVLAVDKAYTAVAHRIGTHELTPLVAPGGPLAGLAAADQGRYICFAGGLPMMVGAKAVGGVGVSGGSAEQDLACARAGLAVYDAAVGD